MITIVTRWIPATDTKPSRIIATSHNARAIVTCQNLKGNEDHIAAAKAVVWKLIEQYKAKFGQEQKHWLEKETWICGDLPDGGMVHVIAKDEQWNLADNKGKE